MSQVDLNELDLLEFIEQKLYYITGKVHPYQN